MWPRRPTTRSRSVKTRRPTIRIREIVEADDPALTRAYKLLSKSFLRHERVSLDSWHASLAERSAGLLTDIAWHLFVAEQDEDVVGLASGTYLGNVNLGVIGYLAMVPAVRARGIGTRLRARLRRQFERDARQTVDGPLAGVLGEVSVANPWLRTLASRESVLVLNFQYYQPSLYDGDKPSPFAFYYESLLRVRSRVPVAELRRILFTIWRRIYRVSRPLEDPAFLAMMHSLGSRRSIGPLKFKPARTP